MITVTGDAQNNVLRRVTVRANSRLKKYEARQAARNHLSLSPSGGWHFLVAAFGKAPGHTVVNCYYKRLRPR